LLFFYSILVSFDSELNDSKLSCFMWHLCSTASSCNRRFSNYTWWCWRWWHVTVLRPWLELSLVTWQHRPSTRSGTNWKLFLSSSDPSAVGT